MWYMLWYIYMIYKGKWIKDIIFWNEWDKIVLKIVLKKFKFKLVRLRFVCCVFVYFSFVWFGLV